VPGLAALDKGGADTESSAVSSPRQAPVPPAGYYTDVSHQHQGFVVTQSR
jgi:hypothetical protein